MEMKMHDELNEIFAKDLGMDLDADLAAASETLEKIAAAEGVDLSQLSDEQVAELVADLMPKVAEFPPGLAEKKDEKREEKAEKKDEKKDDEKKASAEPELTHADVAAALAKYAGDNNIDLTKVSREAWAEAYNKMAQIMSSPEYEAEKQAADEMQAKLAEADVIGRQMARSFVDEQTKIALTEDEKQYHRMRMRENLKGKSETNPARHSAADATKAMGKQKAEERLSRIKSTVGPMGKLQRAVDTVKMKGNLAGKELASAVRKSPGKAGLVAAGGLAAAGAAGYGAKKLMDKQSEAEALELAREYARTELGIDPDTGEKLASASDDEVTDLAMAILREKGYL